MNIYIIHILLTLHTLFIHILSEMDQVYKITHFVSYFYINRLNLLKKKFNFDFFL